MVELKTGSGISVSHYSLPMEEYPQFLNDNWDKYDCQRNLCAARYMALILLVKIKIQILSNYVLTNNKYDHNSFELVLPMHREFYKLSKTDHVP